MFCVHLYDIYRGLCRRIHYVNHLINKWSTLAEHPILYVSCNTAQVGISLWIKFQFVSHQLTIAPLSGWLMWYERYVAIPLERHRLSCAILWIDLGRLLGLSWVIAWVVLCGLWWSLVTAFVLNTYSLIPINFSNVLSLTNVNQR